MAVDKEVGAVASTPYNARRMRNAPAIALAIVVVSVLLSPLHRELAIGDETKYSQVVREMRHGHRAETADENPSAFRARSPALARFFLPTLNGSPFTHK